MIASQQTRLPSVADSRSPGPGEVARQLTGRDYLSYSAVSTYQRCPLRYYFQYVAGLVPDYVSSALVFGGAIHAALELYYRRAFEGAPPPTLDDLMDAYMTAGRNDAGTAIRYGKNETQESLEELAQRMLTSFQESEAAKPVGELLAVEEELREAIIPDCPDVLGRLDMARLVDGRLEIVDFKTSRSKWGSGKIAEAAPQMLLYAELARPLARAVDAREVQLVWIVITKTKQPSVETHTLTPSIGQIARIKSIIATVWRAIKAGHFYPAPSQMSCALCPFGKACQQWEG